MPLAQEGTGNAARVDRNVMPLIGDGKACCLSYPTTATNRENETRLVRAAAGFEKHYAPVSEDGPREAILMTGVRQERQRECCRTDLYRPLRGIHESQEKNLKHRVEW